MLWINAALVVAVIGAMILEWASPAIAFMIGTIIALLINYRSVKEQRERIDAHSKSAMMMVTVLLAAGVFTGVMKEGGFLAALASAVAQNVSPDAATHLPSVVGALSMPLSLLFDPDSFYFGIVPMLAQASAELGVPGEQVARAALLGQMTTGFPVSPLTPATYLLVALARIELGAHQRFTIPYLLIISLAMTAACVILGLFPL
jgi:CitMHS family citrate-Mg2+:H+ or citrate-Ca2+:H+ symporter